MTRTSAPRAFDVPAGVDVVVGDLVGIDALPRDVDAVAVFCFADVRPLRGAAGYVDWRLCGALSRCLESGTFEGQPGETMMLPTAGRFGTRRLFVFGLGAAADCDVERLRQVTRNAIDVIERAGGGAAALAAPVGRGTDMEAMFVRVVGEVAQGRVRHVLVDDAVAAPSVASGG